jgi:PAS domain S-box-containing protein
VILYDITERHRAEEAVKAMESAALFEATFNQAAVGLAHLSLDGKWLRVNEKICHILGYSREELLEMTFQDITYADDLEMTLACVEQMLSGEIGTFVKDIRYLHKRGTIAWMRLTVSLTKKGDGAPDYFISVIEDITEQKQAAAELIRLRAQADIFLEQQILAQTIMALAHELNQPLNAAGSYNEAALRLIKMEQINTAKLTEVIKCAVAEIQRTGNVMRNLMKNIHQNIQDSEVFELNGSLHEAVKAFNAAMYENSALVVLENSGGEVQVSVKRLCLEKVLMNLLWNAQQAIAVKADMSVDPVITIRVAYQQDCVVVSVIDNGPPISQPVADKLFNPFFTTKLNGVGMGLPISRALIESCGGKLWYAAVEGKTAFHFSLKKIVEIQDDAVVATDQGGHRRVNEGDRRTKHDRRNF